MPQPLGYLSLVLHAHLPFVRHPEYDEFLEEDWLYEAITETYLPLIMMMETLEQDGCDFRLTMSLTPTLISMLQDELLQTRYVRHLERLMELADREEQRTRLQDDFHPLAQMYQEHFAACHEVYENHLHRDVVGAFAKFQKKGNLEIITCGATHGFLPLMQNQPEAVNAQVAVAVDHYTKTFGQAPRGIWNGECGFFPGLDKILAKHGLKYFFVDTHGVLFANKRPKRGVFAPLQTPGGPYAFGRDMESSKSVWSAEVGYPGDFRYREFYRDIGYDLDGEYLRPFLGELGLRKALGIKYHRITGKGNLREKEPYVPEDATEAAASHAGHFLFCRQQQVLHLQGLLDRPPLITSPYDAELFGHWWFEGPQFLDFLLRKIHYDQTDVALITPSEYLERYPDAQEAMPSLSSWGSGGYNMVWLEGSNDWIYRHLTSCGARMIDLVNKTAEAGEPDALTERTLNQAARELLLAQSSDWAFIMKTGTTVRYAVKRTKEHLNYFIALVEMVERGDIVESTLADLEHRDNIFPEVSWRVYMTEALGGVTTKV
ncbi:MAG: DUF1957 domain-containing protein [Sumerlaeia bacterium]